MARIADRLGTRLLTALRRARSDERGVTIIEGVVAALILSIGAIAVLGMVDASTRNAYRTEQSQVVTNRLQLEMERIRSLPYSQVALTTLPSSSTDPDNPNYRVSGTRFGLNRNGTSPAQLVYNGGAKYPSGTVTGGVVLPGGSNGTASWPSSFQSGDVKGRIYRYITWKNDPGCPESLCPGSNDLKRATVAILLDATASGGERLYQQLQSDFVDPEAKPVSNPVTPTDSSVTPVIYSLSDAACNASTRPTLANHPTHNTLGLCSAGVSTTQAPGAPDRLFKNATPAGRTAMFDFATDVEPTSGATADTGLQMLPQNTGGCQFSPSGSNSWRYVHRWVTAPVTGTSDLVVDSANLSLYTRALNSGTQGGKVCAFFFTREVNVRGQEVDNKVIDVNAGGRDHFVYSAASWPQSWTAITIQMPFSTLRVSPGDRIGVAIAIDAAANTDPLQFMYDNTTYDSRLTLNTTTPSAAPN